MPENMLKDKYKLNKIQEDDLFRIQVRLFRLFQIKFNLDANTVEKVFKKYEMFDYIKTCYEEYHMQGDDANLKDIIQYLKSKGFKNDIKK